jgi:hypothetical protein
MSFVQRRRFLWILFLAALALLAVVASSTTLSRLRFEELAQQATSVARLRCISAEARWENGEIWTDTRFEVVEQNKGLLPGLVTIRTLGGTIGGLHSRVEGVPEFHAGEEAYVFLWEPRGRAAPHSRLVAGNVSHCERCADGSGNRDPGFRGCTGV